MAIVFNHVSRYDKKTLFIERIETFRDILKEDLVEFYCHEISDETIINGQKWSDLKNSVAGFKYEQEVWFQNLSSYDKDQIRSLEHA